MRVGKSPIRSYWYGLCWIRERTGIVGAYQDYNTCCQSLQSYGIRDSVPIQMPFRDIHTVAKYLKDNGIINVG